MLNKIKAVVTVAAILLLSSGQISAEPYLSVRSGLKCMVCHSNPSGGGKRSEFGRQYSLNILSAESLAGAEYWNGRITPFLALGGDLRMRYTLVDIAGQEDISEFSLFENNIYFEFTLVPNRVTFYVDEKLGPGNVENREVYGLFRFEQNTFYVKAGRMILPYGLRLQDDTAMIRSLSGINFNSSDNGIELGFEENAWTGNLAITNGSGSNSDNDDKKQISFFGRYLVSGWQLGASTNLNETSQNERRMHNIFGGLKTGRIAWLAEIDAIKDSVQSGADIDQVIALVEGNIELKKGHTLKVTYEKQTVDVGALTETKRDRLSLVWEYFPIPFTQFRLGLRAFEGEPSDAMREIDTSFVELHAYY